jgi:hypothetical protein
MIMNKKIFTLLISVVLALSGVSSLSAQGNWARAGLGIGDKVLELNRNANKFYHLRVDSIVTSTGGIGINSGTLNDSIVLFLGRETGTTANPERELFLAPLNRASDVNTAAFLTKGSTAANSAASLWCTVVHGDDPYAVTYSFTNKLQKEMLNLDLDGVTWSPGTDNLRYTKPNVVSGGYYYNWTFSPDYAKGALQERRPLYLPLGTRGDSVAVLCLELNSYDDLPWTNPTPNVKGAWSNIYNLVVKIASAADVENGAVKGLLYFTLYNAQPFVLSAIDFNTNLGSDPAANDAAALRITNRLQFGSNVEGSEFFTGANIRARHIISSDRGGAYVRPADPNNPFDLNDNNPETETFKYSAKHLDDLGYLFLYDRSKTNAYTNVAWDYWNTYDAFLKIQQDALPFTNGSKYLTDPRKDSLRLGQYAFRLVYDPTEDNIKINAFQAAYSPEKLYGSMFIDSDGKSWGTWHDTLVQARLTYVADSSAFEKPVKDGKTYSWADVKNNTGDPAKPDSLAYLYTPLRPGYDLSKNGSIPSLYQYYQRLYVNTARLSNGSGVATLSDEPSTTIKFPLYDECTPSTPGVSDRVTLPSDLYLIRNSKGEYLNVPLYASTDSAVWSPLAEGVDPAYLPSYQWVVKKTVPVGSDPTAFGISPLNIFNREFSTSAYYSRIQLTKDYKGAGLVNSNSSVTVTELYAPWKGINGNYTDAVSGRPVSFLQLTDADWSSVKRNEKLGYEFLTKDEIVLGAYNLDLIQNLYDIRPLSLDASNPALVTTTNTDRLKAATFTLDTIHYDYHPALLTYGYDGKPSASRAKAGYADDEINIVPLKRLLYKIQVSSSNNFSVATAQRNTNFLAFNQSADVYYQFAGTTGSTLKPEVRELGIPAYYLRHVHTAIGDKPSFALVQVYDTFDTSNGKTTNVKAQLKKYLERKYPSTDGIIDGILNKLIWKDNYPANPGLFVASVDAYSGNLKASFRAEENSIPATFRLVNRTDGSSVDLYRRLNRERDGLSSTEVAAGIDRPVWVRLYRANSNGKLNLFENGVGDASNPQALYPKQEEFARSGVNLLGELDFTYYNAPADSAKATLYIDTAYVNRGASVVKPQYLIAVDPQFVPDTTVCDDNGDEKFPLSGFTVARYLINAKDSAKVGTTAENSNYTWDQGLIRLSFVPAVHANDSLYLLGNNSSLKVPQVVDGEVIGFERNEIPTDLVDKGVYRLNKFGKLFLDIRKLSVLGIKGLPLGDNTHKPYVFSFRLHDPDAPEFLIESLPQNPSNVVGPTNGSWVLVQNQVPVVSAQNGSLSAAVASGALFELSPRSAPSTSSTGVAPIISSGVKVISGVGSVTIQGAVGRRVVVTNVLGQSVISKVISSDFETVTLPRGIVLVSVDGAPSLKAIVK